MLDSAYLRKRMVEVQVAGRGVSDRNVLAAMCKVPRENSSCPATKDSRMTIFLSNWTRQTISQPFVVTLMVEAAAIKPHDRVLDVGAASGYAAAVISRIAGMVFAIERHAVLGTAARQRFDVLGYGNINLRVGDGTNGLPEAAAFNAILVAARGPAIAPALKGQLGIGGRLILRLEAGMVRNTCSRSPGHVRHNSSKRWESSGLCRSSGNKAGLKTSVLICTTVQFFGNALGDHRRIVKFQRSGRTAFFPCLIWGLQLRPLSAVSGLLSEEKSLRGYERP